MLKTRYLQLSDIMMLEYNMLGENKNSISNISDLYVTKTKDDHLTIFSPSKCEIELKPDGGYKKKYEPDTLNTINHLTVPKDKEGSLWYMFLDSDYRFCNGQNYYDFYSSDFSDDYNNDFDKEGICNDDKVNEYYKNVEYLESGLKFELFKDITNLRYDSVKIYFVNGYDFSNIYGFTMRMYLNLVSDGDDKFVDLCSFAVTKNNAYMLTKYLSAPIIFGNNIYDRYIEVKIPCVYDLMINNDGKNPHPFYNLVNVIDQQSIKMQFGYIMDDDVSITHIDYDPSELVFKSGVDMPVNCEFSHDSILKGTIPSKKINSDNIGVYIAESPDMPYIEFYGTWNGEPLNKAIVSQFNKGIVLYNQSLVRRDSVYEVDNDYQAEYNMRKWVAMHEIKCSFCQDDKVLKEETYSMSQIFVNDSDETKFKYRPLIFDERLGMDVNHIQITYTMRLVNVDDKVQFLKTGTMSISDKSVTKYYAKGTSLGFSDTRPFKVYNKVIENATPINVNHSSGKQTTKYVKVYYNSSNITLYDGGTSYVPYSYTLEMSQVPKVYKFTFRNTTSDGKYTHIDLSNGSYKLMFRDVAGNVIQIVPTYSNNMNLYLGELEFEITSDHIGKLMGVVEGNKKMSIVSSGENGYMTSLYDFMYNI